jgi:hypothetical protein
MLNAGEARASRLNFIDMGLLVLIWSGSRIENQSLRAFVAALFEMQRIRSCSMFADTKFQESDGHAALTLIAQFRQQARQLNPQLAELSSIQSAPFRLKAA